jgi:hypothetical protein
MPFENEEINVEEIEKEARALGWVPQEEFKGNKDRWVGAEEFVERGHTLMPLLSQNNKRLRAELSTRDQKIDTLTKQVQNANTAIEKLEQHYTEANKRAVDNAKAQLKEELKQAREDNDVDKEYEVREKLDELTERQREINAQRPEKKKEEEKKTPDDTGYTPEFKEWLSENSWFGQDKKKTKEITRIAEDLREDGTEFSGVDFFNECVRVWEERNGNSDEEEEKPRRPTSKVESSANRTSNRKAGGRTYADLPAEAKAACDGDADDFVGPGKRHKDLASWRAAYTKIYFTEE